MKEKYESVDAPEKVICLSCWAEATTPKNIKLRAKKNFLIFVMLEI